MVNVDSPWWLRAEPAIHLHLFSRCRLSKTSVSLFTPTDMMLTHRRAFVCTFVEMTALYFIAFIFFLSYSWVAVRKSFGTSTADGHTPATPDNKGMNTSPMDCTCTEPRYFLNPQLHIMLPISIQCKFRLSARIRPQICFSTDLIFL